MLLIVGLDQPGGPAAAATAAALAVREVGALLGPGRCDPGRSARGHLTALPASVKRYYLSKGDSITMKTKLSRTTVTVFAALAAAGVGYGYYRYLHRPATFSPVDPSFNAIPAHFVLAVCAFLTVIVIQMYRTRKHLSSIWAAPFSQNALQRVVATFLPKPVTLLSVVRAFVGLLPLIIILFEPFRSGSLFTANLDPAETSNAWGGPGYVGATLAHLMDCLILLYVGALILHWLMVKRALSR